MLADTTARKCRYERSYPQTRPLVFLMLIGSAFSEILHEDVPDADDVAEGAGEDEEMEDAMGVGSAGTYGIEDGAGDVHHTLSDEPYHGSRAHTVHQRFEGYEHREAHEDVTHGFDVAVFLEVDETHDGAGYGAEPYETEQPPAPQACIAHGNEGDGAVAAGYVPVDGGMVEAA